MKKFLDSKKNKILLGIIFGLFLFVAIGLIMTGKINIKSIMGNTAQGSYTCPEGYTLNGTNCIKTYASTTNYTCDGIGSNTSDKTKCTTSTKIGSVQYKCPTGSNRKEDGKCYKTEEVVKECPSNIRISSNSNFKVNDNGSCTYTHTVYNCNGVAKETDTEKIYDVELKEPTSGAYSCSAKRFDKTCPGYYRENRSGDKCVSYSCNIYKGYVSKVYQSGKKCYANNVTSSEEKKLKSHGFTCIHTYSGAGSYDINCSNNAFVNSSYYNSPNNFPKAVTTKLYSAKKSYETKSVAAVCPNGGYTQSGPSKCKKDVEVAKEAYCASGKRNGNDCYSTSIVSAKAVHKCSAGGELNQNNSSECIIKVAATYVNIKNDLVKVNSITIDGNINIKINEKKNLNIILKPGNATNKGVTCTSSNEEIAYIESNSLVVGKSEGQVIVTCKANDESGSLATSNVKVAKEVTDSTVTCKENQELKDGKCIDKVITPTCKENQELKDGKCVNKVIENGNTNHVEEPKCPSGYTQSGNICVKKEIINAIVKYSCSNGYTLNNSKCQKLETKEPTSTFTCPVGYSKSGNSCYRIENKSASVTYTCETGYNLNSSTRKCEKTSVINVTNGGYTCPEGYDLIEGTKECIKVTEVNNVTSCPYTYLGGVCIKVDYQNASTIDSCPTGYTLNNGVCEGKTTVEAISSYKCSSGYTLNGKTCTKKITKTVNTNKYCPTGYKLVNDKCQKTVSIAATKNYSCSTGYTLSGTTCTRTLTTELK